MRSSAPLVLLAITLSLLATACPPSDSKGKSSAPPASCTKIGQSCEVSPGKLGSCVQRDDCNDPAGCFVCQSQH